MPEQNLADLEFHVLAARLGDARTEVDAAWEAAQEPMRRYLAARDKERALHAEFQRRLAATVEEVAA